jgi:hypothetical protein
MQLLEPSCRQLNVLFFMADQFRTRLETQPCFNQTVGSQYFVRKAVNSNNDQVVKKPESENVFINLLCNIIIPAAVLSKLSSPERLGPEISLVVALAFPVVYGSVDFLKRKKANAISFLGFVSILLTGGLTLLKVGGFWFAVKEAVVPSLIGCYCFYSLRTKKPLVRAILYNANMIDVLRVDEELSVRNNHGKFERLLINTTWLLSASFFLSAALNFFLAIYILKSPTGTEQFNIELGQMTALSYPVIVLPCTVVTGFALWKLLSGIKHLTGLGIEEVFKAATK